MKTRAQKHQIVSNFTDIQSSDFAIIIEYKGINVKTFESLRRKIHQIQCHCQVMKNTLLKLAINNTDYVEFSPMLKGQNAIIHGKEIFTVLKLLAEMKIKVIAVILEKHMLNNTQINDFSKIGSVNGLYHKMQSCLLSSIHKITSIIKHNIIGGTNE